MKKVPTRGRGGFPRAWPQPVGFPCWPACGRGARRWAVAVLVMDLRQPLRMFRQRSLLQSSRPGLSALQAPARQRPVAVLAAAAGLGGLALLLGGCQANGSAQAERLDRLELRLQQMERRLNEERMRHDGADRSGKLPVGVIKSLTLRSGTQDDRLRIYWADGTTTNLPCTKEQATLVCG